jgi:hypothetical protein
LEEDDSEVSREDWRRGGGGLRSRFDRLRRKVGWDGHGGLDDGFFYNVPHASDDFDDGC